MAKRIRAAFEKLAYPCPVQLSADMCRGIKQPTIGPILLWRLLETRCLAAMGWIPLWVGVSEVSPRVDSCCTSEVPRVEDLAEVGSEIQALHFESNPHADRSHLGK